MAIRNEYEITRYLEKHWEEVFPKFKLIGFGVPISGWDTNKRFGWIDIAFKYCKTTYPTEIKFNPKKGTSDFWDSLKVIGYASALTISHPREKFKPTILIEQSIITTDILPIIYKLKLAYICFKRDEEGIIFSYSL